MYILQNVQCISALVVVVFYVKDVFAVPKCQVSTGLAYVRPVAYFTYQFVFAALSWSCVVSWVIGSVSCRSGFVHLKVKFISIRSKSLVTYLTLKLC